MNLLLYIYVFILASIIIFLIYWFLNKNYFTEKVSSDTRKIHSTNVIRLGGLTLLSILPAIHFLNDPLGKLIIIFGLLFLLVGTLEDLFEFIPPLVRALIMILLISFFIVSNNLIITDVDNAYVSSILSNNNLIASIFTILCLFLLINGNNFIDGLNGLILGTTNIILIHFLFLISNYESDLYLLNSLILIPTIIVFFVNLFWGKILTGDGGSYYLGFFVGILSILLAQDEGVESFKIACLVFYPCFEVIFTIFRRLIINRKNPFYPDGKHLHQLLFIFISKRYIKVHSNTLNSLTSLVILSAVAFSHLLVAFSPIDLNYILIFIILVVSYILIYLILEKSISD